MDRGRVHRVAADSLSSGGPAGCGEPGRASAHAPQARQAGRIGVGESATLHPTLRENPQIDCGFSRKTSHIGLNLNTLRTGLRTGTEHGTEDGPEDGAAGHIQGHAGPLRTGRAEQDRRPRSEAAAPI